MKKKTNDLTFNYSMIDKDYSKGYLALAPIWKRALAGLVDFLLFIFITTSFYFGFKEIFLTSSNVKKINNEFSNVMKESGLFKEENNEFSLFESNNYLDYQDIVFKFYSSNLNNIDNKETVKDVYWFNVYLLGQDDELNKFDDENNKRYKFVLNNGKKYFEYSISKSGEKEYDKFATIKKDLYIDNELPKDTYNKILNYYYNLDSNCVYAIACNDLYSTNVYQTLRTSYSRYYFNYPLYVSLPLSYFIIYVLPILIFKNGETFAKKIFNLCLVDINGYSSNKFKNIFRMLIPILFILIIFIFNPMFALILFLLMIFTSFLLMIFNTMHKSLFDFCGLTLCIDNKESIWFKSKYEQLQYEENMKKIKKL